MNVAAYFKCHSNEVFEVSVLRMFFDEVLWFFKPLPLLLSHTIWLEDLHLFPTETNLDIPLRLLLYYWTLYFFENQKLEKNYQPNQSCCVKNCVYQSRLIGSFRNQLLFLPGLFCTCSMIALPVSKNLVFGKERL